MKTISLILMSFCLFMHFLRAETIYVNSASSSPTGNGTPANPFKTIEKALMASIVGDTVFIKSGNYTPAGGELILKPGTILFGEDPANTIINADIRDTSRSELPFEVHNLTFGEFYCSRGKNLYNQYNKPCIIKNSICRFIGISHGGGYDEVNNIFAHIPFFHIESNTVSGEITFSHGPGKNVGRNMVRNNTAGIISLKHGALTAPLYQPEPGYGYLIENNKVTGEISFKQGASVDSSSTEIIKDLIRIMVSNNKVDIIEIQSGSGYTYIIDKNTIQKGIEDASAACWTTISNNTIINGAISDKSGGPGLLDCDDDPGCMVEDQFIENNTIFFEASGDPDEDYAIAAVSRSVTIRGNKITCKGPAGGILTKSGAPTHIMDNHISVEKDAEFGIFNYAGYGLVTGNIISGGKIGYYSKAGTVLFEGNTITGSHWGFYSQGAEEVKNNTITHCTGHGMVLDGLRGPVTGNTVTGNDSTGIWVIREVDLGGGAHNGAGRNIIRGNSYYDMRISVSAVTPDTLFINNNVWDHETIGDILQYDILNESAGGNLLLWFTSVIAKPATVQLDSPDDLAVLTTYPALLSWQAAPSAEAYRLQVSAASGFETPLLDTLVDATAYTIGSLPNQADFHWRVQAVNPAGEGNWSETRQFSTQITGVHETPVEKEGVMVYPNPTTGKFTIHGSGFTVQRVEVMDLSGKVVESFPLQTAASGREFDISRLPAGLYFIKMMAGERVLVRKIIVKQF